MGGIPPLYYCLVYQVPDRIKGLNYKNSWKTLGIPVDGIDHGYQIPKLRPHKKKEGIVLDLDIENMQELERAPFPQDIRDKFKYESLRLEDLLELKEKDKAIIRIYLFGYDGFSGTRKVFESPSYNIDSIQPGTFDGLQIKEVPRKK